MHAYLSLYTRVAYMYKSKLGSYSEENIMRDVLVRFDFN